MDPCSSYFQNLATTDGDEIEEKHSQAHDSAALQDMRRVKLKTMIADYDEFVKLENSTVSSFLRAIVSTGAAFKFRNLQEQCIDLYAEF